MVRPQPQGADAERALRARAAHHHRADGDSAVGSGVRVHGAALEHGDAASVGGGGAGHLRADRCLQDLPARQGSGAAAPHRPEPPRPRGGFPAAQRYAAAGPEAVLLAAGSSAVAATEPSDRPPVLDRYGGRSNLVEIRIKRDDTVMRVYAERSAAYASNSQIFIFWMLGTSSILLIVAVLFLRNQIRPILHLADAAENFGKGRDAPNFRPRGAREVRRAAQAFMEMKERVERSFEQRTTMLAGVSHDLRTILTRFKLELALIGDGAEADGMRKDVDEMSGMLEDYLAFARGDSGEQATPSAAAVVPPGEVTFLRSVSLLRSERCKSSPEPATVSRAYRVARSGDNPAATPARASSSASKNT